MSASTTSASRIACSGTSASRSIRIDRDEKVLAVDLDAVAGVEHQRDRIRPLAAAILVNSATVRRMSVCVRLGACTTSKPAELRNPGDRLGVVNRVRQRGHRGNRSCR